MSFWQDSAPWVKAVLVVGVLAIVYLVVARFAEILPFGCAEGAHCEGLLCGDCAPDADSQERGFRPANAVAPEGGGQ